MGKIHRKACCVGREQSDAVEGLVWAQTGGSARSAPQTHNACCVFMSSFVAMICDFAFFFFFFFFFFFLLFYFLFYSFATLLIWTFILLQVAVSTPTKCLVVESILEFMSVQSGPPRVLPSMQR